MELVTSSTPRLCLLGCPGESFLNNDNNVCPIGCNRVSSEKFRGRSNLVNLSAVLFGLSGRNFQVGGGNGRHRRDSGPWPVGGSACETCRCSSILMSRVVSETSERCTRRPIQKGDGLFCWRNSVHYWLRCLWQPAHMLRALIIASGHHSVHGCWFHCMSFKVSSDDSGGRFDHIASKVPSSTSSCQIAGRQGISVCKHCSNDMRAHESRLFIASQGGCEGTRGALQCYPYSC